MNAIETLRNPRFSPPRPIVAVLVGIVLYGCGAFGYFQGDPEHGDVDLSEATPLVALAVDHPPGVVPGSGSGNNPTPEEPVHNLFDAQPGQWVTMTSMMGTIDPVGTSLPNDFDGDGILNENETTTNIWVADYPEISTRIATPITMQIEILETATNTTEQISSSITSEDMKLTKNEGSENIHRHEVNTKTVQFQDSWSANYEQS